MARSWGVQGRWQRAYDADPEMAKKYDSITGAKKNYRKKVFRQEWAAGEHKMIKDPIGKLQH